MNRLFIGNVSTKVDPSELKHLMEDCGKIKYFDIKDGSGYMVFLLNSGIRNNRRSRRSDQKV